MDPRSALQELRSNPEDVAEECVKILLKIADNVLSDPSNLKVRTLQKGNATVSKKVLLVAGGPECLKLMGFQENNTCYSLPMSSPIENVRETRSRLLKWKEKEQEPVPVVVKSKDSPPVQASTSHQESKAQEVIKPENPVPNVEEGSVLDTLPVARFKLPPLEHMFSNPFLRQVEVYFHQALAYDDPVAQRRAKALIPLASLEVEAQKSLRLFQEQLKKNGQEDLEYCFEDFLALELMHWFKEDFFSWVDTLDCESCGGKTVSTGLLADTKNFPLTKRVEVHKCESCAKANYFPRYSDLNILLESRRGRCGEWAQVFTLCCKSLGFDARYVVDELDHVWTEVYSPTQKRWVHFDPCEDVSDAPLLYETGWGKKLTYVMAYSPEEVQDVTWRYTGDHRGALKRRNKCGEHDLVDAILKLRAVRQSRFSQHRKNYLNLRVLRELTELLLESIEGRHIVGDTLTIRYSAARDRYEQITGNGDVSKVDQWDRGVFSYVSVFRKEERDWKVVYLARTEGAETGSVSWKFQVIPSDKVIDTLRMRFDRELYENGEVQLVVKGDDDVIVSQGEVFKTRGCKSVTITVNLGGGKGGVAWQHAQLFRQPSDSQEYPFSVTLTFRTVGPQ